MSTDASKAETVVAYAALILADEGLEITPEKLQTLISAAKIEDIEPIWTTLFAKALQGKDVKDILTKVTTSTQEVGQKKVSVDGNTNDMPDQGEVYDGEDIQNDSDDGEAFLSLFD